MAYARQADLITKHVTSEANLDTARAKRDTAQAAVKRIEAVIAQKTIAGAVRRAASASARWRRGSMCRPAWRWSRCRRSIPIRVDFPMPEQHIGKLRVGQPVELTVDAYPGQIFKGEIQSLDARVAQDTRTLLVRGILPNKERKLLPGMFANVTVPGGRCRPTWSPCRAPRSPTASTATASTW